MSVRYLKFSTREHAIEVLTANNATFDEYFIHFDGCGWGSIFTINTINQETGECITEDGYFCNLYDYSADADFSMYEIPAPNNPRNVRA